MIRASRTFPPMSRSASGHGGARALGRTGRQHARGNERHDVRVLHGGHQADLPPEVVQVLARAAAQCGIQRQHRVGSGSCVTLAGIATRRRMHGRPSRMP